MKPSETLTEEERREIELEKNSDYSKKLYLKHHQAPAIVNTITGEVKTIGKGNPNKTCHDKHLTFKKFYSENWQLLKTQVTDKEYMVAFNLALQAKAYTNSLEPLGPDMATATIAELLGEDRRTIMSKINKLIRLGVLAVFTVYEMGGQRNNYWIFNPYLSFNGKVVDKKIAKLFERTFYAYNAMRGNNND